VGFFEDIKDADKLDAVVEDIRDAIMGYQVCMPKYSCFPCLTSVSGVFAAGNL